MLGRQSFLGDDPVYDFASNISEPEISTGVAVGEFFVINAHEMEDGGVEVMDVDRFVFGIVSVVVG